jgi:O-antigen ligase
MRVMRQAAGRSHGPTVAEPADPDREVQPQFRFGGLEIWLWGLGLFLFTSPFVFQLTGLDPGITFQRDMATMRRTSGSGLLIYVMRYMVMIAAVAPILPEWRRYVARLRDAGLPLALFGWAMLSLLWTDSFTSSLNSVLAMLPLLVFGTCMAFRLPLQLFARAFSFAAIWFALFSILYVVFLPYYGVHQQTDFAQQIHAGSWRGTYSHKNNFGGVAAAFAVVAMFSGRTVLPSTAGRLLLLGVLLFMVYKSNSATALLLSCVGPVTVIALLRLTRMQQLLLALCIVPVALLVLGNAESLVELLGRDLTFTGRTSLWSYAFDAVIQRPLTGYGFGSTTYGDFMVTIYRIFSLFDPHNGYLDLLLGTGLVGLSLFAMSIFDMMKVSRGLVHRDRVSREAAMVVFCLMATWVFANLSESQEKPLGSYAGLAYTAFGFLLYRRLLNDRGEAAGGDHGADGDIGLAR